MGRSRCRSRDPNVGYGRDFAYGGLSEAAENRKSVVAALLPKLAIADRCRIDGRYLMFRGKLDEERIYRGSANVMIEPGGRPHPIAHSQQRASARGRRADPRSIDPFPTRLTGPGIVSWEEIP